MRKNRIIVCKRSIDAFVKDEEYMQKLAEALMLGELLCGEASPQEFLKRTMKQVYAEMVKPTSMIKPEFHDQWVDE